MSTSGINGLGSSLSVGANYYNSPTVAISSAQQQQIQQILQDAQSQGLSISQVQNQINAVLTPAQQQQLQNQIGQHRHHHHSGGASSAGSSTTDDQTDEFGIPTQLASGSSTAGQTISNIAASFWAQSQQQQNNNNT